MKSLSEIEAAKQGKDHEQRLSMLESHREQRNLDMEIRYVKVLLRRER